MQDNSFWSTDKGKAAIKMILWVIFIAILFIIFAVGGNDTSSNELGNTYDTKVTDNVTEYTFVTFDVMQSKLLEGNYEYTYKITGTDYKYIFSGVKADGEELGFKESNDGVVKYYIKDGIVYNALLNNVGETINLYETIDTSFLDMKLLFDNLKEYLYSVEKNEDKRTITYSKDGYGVVVKTDLENITNIIVTLDDVTYDLEFTKVGECAKIGLTEN